MPAIAIDIFGSLSIIRLGPVPTQYDVVTGERDITRQRGSIAW